MRDIDRARMQMELVLDLAFGTRGRAAIFEIAHDGGAQRRQMHANLVGAASDGLGCHPAELLARLAENGVIRDRVLGAVDVALHHRHLLVVARFAFLGDRPLDGAAMRPRHTLGQRPIDLGRVASPDRFAERGRRRRRPRHHEHAGRVAIEAVDQPRFLLLAKGEELEQPIDMARDSAAALRGQASRLVENQHGIILMDYKTFREDPLIAIDLWTNRL
jgi:hypothetical protein